MQMPDFSRSVHSFDASEQQCGQQTLLPVCEVPGHIGPEVSGSQGVKSFIVIAV